MAIVQADASLRITNVDLLLKRGRLGEFIDPQPTNDHTHEVTRCASPTHILSRCPIAEPAECLGVPLSLPLTFSDAGCACQPRQHYCR